MTREDPGKVIAKGHILGLRALVNLLRERTIKETHQLYTRAQKRLSSALKKWEMSLSQGSPDFSIVADLEKKLRDIELENIWETTARHGNKERKRIRNAREGPIGSLNKLINIFGAKLRDYFLLMNPLELPKQIGKRKTKTVWGYESSEFGKVPVAHGADLAELDLADMLRSHGRELCRKAFMSGVDSKAFEKYALLLIRRLATFADYIYTEGCIGKKEFLRPKVSSLKRAHSETDSDEILRELVEEIDALYGKRVGRRVYPSRVRPEEDVLPTSQFFREQIRRLRTESVDAPRERANALLAWTGFLKKLTGGKRPKLRDQDARHLYRQIRNNARWEGEKCHSLTADGLPQPYRLESIVLESNRFARHGEDLLVTGETPLRTAEGPGRADLIVFVSTSISNPNRPDQLSVMKPIAVFDIKTKTGFNWEIKAQKSTGKRKKTVPKFIVRKRGLTDEEWEEAVSEIPSKSDAHQLALYEDAIIREYSRLTGDDSLRNLLKGVIILDTQFDSVRTREIVRSLVQDLRDSVMVDKAAKKCDRLLVRYRGNIADRAAIVLLEPSESQVAVLQLEEKSSEDTQVYSPFSESRGGATKHILYLSARSASNSGFTAAWIAKYWHGLQYTQQLSEENDDASVVWLDLAGVFSDPELAMTRLRIGTQDQKTQNFFDKIEFVDISSDAEGFLFQGKNPPNIERICVDTDGETKKRLVVISGWNWVENSLPKRLEPALAELERYLVQELARSGCMTLWFLDPRPDELTSDKYQSRCLLPFWNESPHRFHVTELVWNLPVKPYSSTHTTPMLDDLRVVIHQKQDGVEADLIEVPLLENWSARFWSKRSKREGQKRARSSRGRIGYSAEDILSDKAMSEELINDSIDLIPWIRFLHPVKFKERKKVTLNLSIQTIPLYGEPSKPKSVMSRVRYEARPRGARGRKGYIATTALIPKQEITHPRHYRRWRKKKRSAPNAETYQPPKEEHLEYRLLREQTACNVEVRRMKQDVKLLRKQRGAWSSTSDWQDFLGRLQRLLPSKIEPVRLDHLSRISELLMVDDISSDLWDSLLWVRERRLGVGLRVSENETLETLLESKPYVATHFGNYLLLTLLAITRKYPELRVEEIRNLWEAVKAWHLRQIGFHLRGNPDMQTKPKFDMRAVWSNLCKRASVLMEMPLPVQSAVRYGQLVVNEYDADYDYWVFLEDSFDKVKLQSGLWIGQNPLRAVLAPSWSESQNKEVADHATDVKSPEVHDLLVCKIEGVDYVWLYAENEWNLQGELAIIPRRRSAITGIRGIQVKPTHEPVELPVGIGMPSDFEQRIKRELSEIGRLRQHVYGVRCELGVDSGMYSISFETDGELVDRRVVSRTSDLLQLLRRPLVDGVPLQSSQYPDVYMTWSPYEDIIYGELRLLQPYVERKTPYVQVRTSLPLTCEELVQRSSRTMSLVICHDGSSCPIVDGSAKEHGLCWRLKHTEKGHAPELTDLVETPLSDHDISSLLLAREVFLEEARYDLDLQFEKDPGSREGWVFRESKRISRVLNLKPFSPGVFMHLDSEKMHYSLVRLGGGIQVTVRSDLTGERVSSGALIPSEGKWDVQSAIEKFMENTESFIETYFGRGQSPRRRIVDYDGVLNEMRTLLKKISKK